LNFFVYDTSDQKKKKHLLLEKKKIFLIMQTSQHHCVGAVFDDFRKEHTIGQTLHTLQGLQGVMDKIFDGIISRVNEEADRISQIDGRIEEAKAKVKKITGITTSTTVHCAAKYPASEKVVGFKRLNQGATFARTPQFSLPDENAHYLPSDRKISRKRERNLIGLYSAVNPDLSQFENGLKRGLGQLPQYLPSTSSMLLFDSTSNPYKDYNVLPSLMGRDVKRRVDDAQGRSMGDAPDTFMNPDAALNAQQLDFLHRPAAPEVAPMEFMDLKDFDPSFKNIASNINYASLSGSALPSIAPTAHQKSGLPDLPAIMDTPGAQTSSIPAVSSTTAPPPPPVTSTTKAPPPPPPPPVTTKTAPPPPTNSKRPSITKVDKRPKEEQPTPMAGGLLGDIAKGLKLKSAKKRKLKKPKKKGKPTLADQLRNRLNRRANFMSGRNRSKGKKKKKKIKIKMKKEPGKPKSSLNFNAIPKARERSHTCLLHLSNLS